MQGSREGEAICKGQSKNAQRHKQTKGRSKGKTTEDFPEEANNAVDKLDDSIKCEQDSESLKTMEWAEDMVWVLDSAAQVLVAQGLSLTTQLLPEEEMAWRSGMHLIFTKKCKYVKLASPADITSGAEEHVDYENWPLLNKAIFARITHKSLECVKQRQRLIVMYCLHVFAHVL